MTPAVIFVFIFIYFYRRRKDHRTARNGPVCKPPMAEQQRQKLDRSMASSTAVMSRPGEKATLQKLPGSR